MLNQEFLVSVLKHIQQAVRSFHFFFALCLPNDKLKELQDKNEFSRLMIMQEKIKTLPFSDIWEKYCKACGVSADEEKWYSDIEKYEKEVLSKRN